MKLRRELPLYLRAFDALMRPQIHGFALRTVLATSESELMKGAALAARRVSDAYRQQLCCDAAPLQELREAGSIHPRLYAVLAAEITQGQQAGCTELMAEELQKQRDQLEAEPLLESMCLVIGCQRPDFQPAGLHRLSIGSHLVVVADSDSGLWRQERQRRLLWNHGCTLQLLAMFEKKGAAGAAQTYLFEAGVPAHTIQSRRTELNVPANCQDLEFSLVDMNNLLRGNQFWSSAAEVRLL